MQVTNFTGAVFTNPSDMKDSLTGCGKSKIRHYALLIDTSLLPWYHIMYTVILGYSSENVSF